MSLMGPGIVQSLGGVERAARDQSRKKGVAASKESTVQEVIDTVETSDHAEAARKLAGSTEEDAQQDRKSKPPPTPKKKPENPTLDLQG